MKVEKPIKGITAYPRIDIQLFQGYSLEVAGCSAFTRDRSHPSYAIDKKSLIGDVLNWFIMIFMVLVIGKIDREIFSTEPVDN